MIDWQLLSKVAEFNLGDDRAKADPRLSQSALSFLDYMEPEEELPAPPPAPEKKPELPPAAPVPPPLAFNTDFWIPESERKAPFWTRSRAGAAIAAAFLVFSFSLWQFTRSGFPVLKDLPAREMQELRAIAAEDPAAADSAGAALAPLNLKEPRFYIAANAADGTVLEVQLQGLRETMLDSFYYSSSAQVKVKNHFAKTPAFVQDAGKPLVPGEYTLTIYKNGAQLAQKTFFLGGIKDRDYSARLQSYQGKLRVQAEAELSEIHQVTDLLEKQFNETNQRYKSGKGWEKFHQQWTALQGQIEILFKEVNSEILNKEFYHGPLYGLLNEATQDVSRLHNEHNTAFMLGAADARKIADLSRSAQAKLLTLRAKLLQAERQSGI
jgi:hypothetical protein